MKNCSVGLPEDDSFPLAVYPNPVNDFLHIQFADNQGLRGVILSDPMGKTLLSLPAATVAGQGPMLLNCKELASGLYILTLLFEKESDSRKVLKL